MNDHTDDPHTVLGVDADASPADITTAYRRALRACHPDTAHPDHERLAAVITAYRRLRDREPQPATPQPPRSSHGHPIPVHVRHTSPPPVDLRAGPVRRHRSPG